MWRQSKKLEALARTLAAQPEDHAQHADHSNPLVAAIMAAQPYAEGVEAYLWPECQALWQLWCEVQTQWRYSAMGGPTGLDYAGVRAYLECSARLRGEPLREAFDCIRAAERGHLTGLAQRPKRD